MKKILYLLVFTISLALAGSSLFAATYALHQGGMCSSHWLDGKKGNATLGQWNNVTSINCYVNMKDSIAAASQEFKTNYLNQYCTGNNWCYIFNYSAGDVLVGYTLANNSTQWNIIYVATTGGAGGGSELAGSAAAIFTCDLAEELSVSHTRNLYNHNDTNGNTIYHIYGIDGWWYSSWLLPGEDDGAVSVHSAGACTNSVSYDNACTECTQWSNHSIYTQCPGYGKDHYEMKMQFIDILGG